jgi:hypothetical protein
VFPSILFAAVAALSHAATAVPPKPEPRALPVGPPRIVVPVPKVMPPPTGPADVRQ